MARNIKKREAERLAAETAKLAHGPKTVRGGLTREQRIDRALSRFRREFPAGDFGRAMTKAEEEYILGFGPDGG